MSVAILFGMACTVFLTSRLSPVFGMAGGSILLWIVPATASCSG
ncbi:MAG: hypothetical protein ACK4QP_22260 [Pseudorhizobium sp.]